MLGLFRYTSANLQECPKVQLRFSLQLNTFDFIGLAMSIYQLMLVYELMYIALKLAVKFIVSATSRNKFYSINLRFGDVKSFANRYYRNLVHAVNTIYLHEYSQRIKPGLIWMIPRVGDKVSLPLRKVDDKCTFQRLRQCKERGSAKSLSYKQSD